MKRLLYIDDSIDDMETFVNDFSDAGYSIQLAGSALIALSMLEGMAYDLIICDLMLNGKNGLYFAREMEKLGLKIPYIFTSGVPLLDCFQEYKADHYLGFVEKPVTPSALQKFLRGDHGIA